MSNNSLKLQQQWSKRPADQCFDSFESVHAYNEEKEKITRFGTVNLGEVKAIPIDDDNDIALQAFGKELTLTNFAFTRLTEAVDLGPEMLRKLPAPMVCDILNYKMGNTGANIAEADLQEWEKDQSGRAINTTAKLIYESNGTDLLKTVTGPNYHYLPDRVVSGLMLDLANEFGLLPAPLTVGVDGANNRGLYASGSDTFLFASNMNKPVLCFADSPIYRGLMIWNGYQMTVGGAGFDFSGICSNYSIRQYTQRFSFNLRHSAKFKEKFDVKEIVAQAKAYFNASTVDDENFLRLATTKTLGDSDETVKETLLKLREPLLGKKTVEHIIELAPQREKIYGNPRTVWSIANVVTEIGRDRPTASARNGYMNAAKSIFDIASV